MIKEKPIDFGCVILCPDQSVRNLMLTIKSIRHYSNAPCIAVVPSKTPKEITEAMKVVCEIHKGKATYTSLFNIGMKKATQDWNLVIFSGSTVKPKFWAKYLTFIKNEKDIFYPIVDRKYGFVEGSMNGLFLSKTSFADIGEFTEDDNIETVKTLWSYNALCQGYKLKGVLGVKING